MVRLMFARLCVYLVYLASTVSCFHISCRITYMTEANLDKPIADWSKLCGSWPSEKPESLPQSNGSEMFKELSFPHVDWYMLLLKISHPTLTNPSPIAPPPTSLDVFPTDKTSNVRGKKLALKYWKYQ